MKNICNSKARIFELIKYILEYFLYILYIYIRLKIFSYDEYNNSEGTN